MTKSKYIIIGAVVSILTIVGYFVGMYLLGSFVPNPWVSSILDIVFKIVVGIVTIVLLKTVLKVDKIGFTKKGIIMGTFIYGAMCWIYIILNYIAGISEIDRTFIEAMPYLILFFFMCLGIGFVEEMLFRGLILNYLRKVLENKKYGIILAVILSSLIFGGCHLFNLISRPHMVVSTITQVIYASIIGAYFAVVYIKSGNILSPIILHTIFDFVYYIWHAFSNEAIISANIDTTILSGVISIALHIPIIVWTILVSTGMFDFDKQ